MATTKPAGPVPDQARLREKALRHLERFSATEATLVRVLDRAVQRWAMRAEREGSEVGAEVAEARIAVRAVAAALVQAGIVDDAGFARARAARLLRRGRSRRAIGAHLVGKGVASELVASVTGEEEEFPAALAFARRRRLGPFRPEPTGETRLRDLAILARAGFPRAVAERALGLDADAAETLLLDARQA